MSRSGPAKLAGRRTAATSSRDGGSGSGMRLAPWQPGFHDRRTVEQRAVRAEPSVVTMSSCGRWPRTAPGVLKQVARDYPADVEEHGRPIELHLIMDNHAPHKRNDRWRPVGSARLIGDIPPAWRSHLDPTGVDTPTSAAASSVVIPSAIDPQNARCTARDGSGRPS